MLRQSRSHRFAQYFISCTHRRRILRNAGIHAQTLRPAGSAKYGDGIRARDDHQVRANWGAHRGDPHHFVARQTRTRAAPAEVSRRLAEPPAHAALRAELAIPAAGHRARAGWTLSRVLAAARTAPDFSPCGARPSHHDFWRYFYAAGGADPVNRSIRKGLQLCRAL